MTKHTIGISGQSFNETEPTPELRYLMREVYNFSIDRHVTQPVLQQKWSVREVVAGKSVRFGFEWRDVPIVEKD
jgi:hypothetical protein